MTSIPFLAELWCSDQHGLTSGVFEPGRFSDVSIHHVFSSSASDDGSRWQPIERLVLYLYLGHRALLLFSPRIVPYMMKWRSPEQFHKVFLTFPDSEEGEDAVTSADMRPRARKTTPEHLSLQTTALCKCYKQKAACGTDVRER